MLSFFFFFNDTATTEIYTLSLHDALPIFALAPEDVERLRGERGGLDRLAALPEQLGQRLQPEGIAGVRSEEHTSELQSQSNLVCRLLLEKKKKKNNK